jgi:hypothetical protein
MSSVFSGEILIKKECVENKKGGSSQRRTAPSQKEEEEGRILAYVSNYHACRGTVKKKVLHSGNLMLGDTP